MMFTDEAAFHMNGHVNRHSCRLCGHKWPYKVYEYVQDPPEVSVWCGIMLGAENSIIWNIYLNMCVAFASFHKSVALNKKKKVKFYVNMAVLHATSVMMYEVPWMSYFLIV